VLPAPPNAAQSPGSQPNPRIHPHHQYGLQRLHLSRAQVSYYRGTLSPDFYAWIFPHGDTASVGTGSAHKGFR
jgi:flavin-dependent dehydrogenase